MLNKITGKVLAAIKSRGFYQFVIAFFIFEAAWIALTANYPQAFDEQFHFGLIRVYSHYLFPFLSKQPAGADQFGAVARDPSYLYHYLMSFPYRLIELITNHQAYQVIALRFIDIGMFAAGLVLFRRILIKTKLSVGLSNLAILVFILIPIVPQLAGQINYDDMLFPLVALACLISFRMIDEIRKLKLSFKTTASLLIVATFTSLVKYAFLPIFLAIVCFFVFYLWRYYRSKLPVIWHNFAADFKKTSLKLKVVLIAGIVLAAGMFVQRDLINLVDYHSIDPGCSSVLTIDQCKAYSVWYSDYTRHNTLVVGHAAPSRNIIAYGGEWLYWMWYRLFFAINGPTNGYTNYPPLPLPSAIALVVGLAGLVAVIRYWREIFRGNAYASLLFIACLFYVIALIIQGYSSYQFTSVLENMNGRYLLPILLLAGALVAKAFSIALKKSEHLKVLLACIVVVLFLEGGGILTYIARSDNTWYWQNSKAIKANEVAKNITKKIVVKGKSQYSTGVWFFN